jgi:hypothetical protein
MLHALAALNSENLRTEEKKMHVIKCPKISPQERPPPSSRENYIYITLKIGG